MVFNSLSFIIFFIVVICIYFMLPHRFRWVLLLLSSLYFYMCAKPEFVLLILITTTISFYTSIKVEEATTNKVKRIYLALNIVTSLGVLFIFKYIGFVGDSIDRILDYFNYVPLPINFDLLLPIGISFYTFQTLSYCIDVYRGDKKAERHLGIYALYVSFFPQLVAGPIERSTNLIPQFYAEQKFDYTRVVSGLKLMLWGFFMKVVIADRLAITVNQVYNNVGDYQGLPLWIATFFFSIQIFSDFSGYTLISIGIGKVMGFNLMTNFKRPYLAKNVSDFWRRWHISLSSWFRDYLYIPLGGNRVAKWRWQLNIFIVFLVSGLWHGANWTFIIWGALHGFYQVFSIWTIHIRESFTNKIGLSKLPKLHSLLKIGITFSLVLFAWIFFRANTISDAFYVIGNLFTGFELSMNYIISGIQSLQVSNFEFLIGVLLIVFLLAVNVIEEKAGEEITDLITAKHVAVRWAGYYALLLSIIFLGVYSDGQFIYFQF